MDSIKQLKDNRDNLSMELVTAKLGLPGLEKQIKDEKNNIHRLGQKINSLNQKLNRATKGAIELTVSDHAVLRYIERVMKIDVDKIKSIILTDDIKAFSNSFGGQGTFAGESFKAMLKDNTVVTITNK